MSIDKKVRSIIKRQREELGISKAEAARRTGITVAAYSCLERGVTGDMRLSTIEMVFTGLGLRIDITAEPLHRVNSSRSANKRASP